MTQSIHALGRRTPRCDLPFQLFVCAHTLGHVLINSPCATSVPSENRQFAGFSAVKWGRGGEFSPHSSGSYHQKSGGRLMRTGRDDRRRIFAATAEICRSNPDVAKSQCAQIVNWQKNLPASNGRINRVKWRSYQFLIDRLLRERVAQLKMWLVGEGLNQ